MTPQKRNILMARLALVVGTMLIAGVAVFGGQAGVGLNNQLVAHKHRGSSDGGTLNGLNPAGIFYINTNNNGNIVVPPTLSGSIFIWNPGKSNFSAGFSSGAGFYTANLGTGTISLGEENLATGHYSGILGYGNTISGFRYNNYFLGNYMTSRANNAIMIGNGDNLYRSVNTSTNTIKFYNVATAPAMTIAQAPSYTVTSNIGIGTESPAYKLDVAGDVNAVVYHGDGSELVGVVGASGMLYIDTDGNLTPSVNEVTDTFLEVVDSGDITPKA